MPKTECPNCGSEIEYTNSFCDKCGTETPRSKVLELNGEYSERICSRYTDLQELLESHAQVMRKLSLTPWDGFKTTVSNSNFVKNYGGCLNEDGTVEYRGISKDKLHDIILMCKSLFSQCMYEQKSENNIEGKDYDAYLVNLAGLNASSEDNKKTCLDLANNVSNLVLYSGYIDEALTMLEEDVKRLTKGYKGESGAKRYLENIVGTDGLYSNAIFEDPFQDGRVSENDLLYISRKGIITFEIKNNNYSSITVSAGRAEYKTYDGQIIEQDPLGQSRYHALVIKELLKQSSSLSWLKDLDAVHEAVVISNPNTVITNNGYPVMNLSGVENYLASLEDVMNDEQVAELKAAISSENQNDSEREFEVTDYQAIFPDKVFWDELWENLTEIMNLIASKNSDQKLLDALGSKFFIYPSAPVKDMFARNIDKFLHRINGTDTKIYLDNGCDPLKDSFYVRYDKSVELWIKISEGIKSPRPCRDIFHKFDYIELSRAMWEHCKKK